jgi:hypothetical protein
MNRPLLPRRLGALVPLALLAGLSAGCATPIDEQTLAERESRECRTGMASCRKPTGAPSGDVRTVSGEAVRSGSQPQASKPAAGTQ